MHSNSKILFDRYVRSRITRGMRVLEVGPDGFPSTYQRLVGDAGVRWDTIDIRDEPQLTFRATGENAFPIPDDTYDVVLSGQVIEHVRCVWLWTRELARVCRSGGEVATLNPVSWTYHEAPIDCWRIYPEGMRALYEDAGLEVLVSACESLEYPFIRRRIPGRSLDVRSRPVRLAGRILGPLGFPVQCAYDTVTVGRKRTTAAGLAAEAG